MLKKLTRRDKFSKAIETASSRTFASGLNPDYESSRARTGHRQLFASCLIIMLAVCFAFPAQAAIECRDKSGQVRDCSILVVHSYHPSLKWSQILSENFASSIASEPNLRIDTEFLDAKRRPSLEHAGTFLQLLREKYGTRLPDVLVISDDPGFDLLWPIREELLPGVPIVFMGLNSIREELETGISGVTGAYERQATKQSAQLALELTGSKGIIIINDTSETGSANEVVIEELISDYPEVQWVIERDLSAKEIDRIASLPDDWSIITMLPLREAGANSPMLTKARSVELLRNALPNPIFSDSAGVMGSGMVGGYILSGADHARQVGEKVLEILRGAAAETIAISYDVKHQWTFDQRELDRFNWSHDRLPKDSVFQFSEEEFWSRHRAVILPMLGALVAAGLIILFLSAIVRNQRRAKVKLRKQQQRLSAALAATHAGVFEVRPNGNYASPRWLELIARDADQIPQQTTEGWMHNATADSKTTFDRALNRLAGDSEREVFELKINDTQLRTLEVVMTSSPAQVNQENSIIGVATDVTTTRHLEEEAARRNRLEMLGELAGGIAHDFNNFLLVVQFSADLAKELDDPKEMRQLVVDIEEAGSQTTNMVKQLLTFGRNDTRSGNIIELNEAIGEIQPFLQRMTGANCEVVTTLRSEPYGVRIDRPELERVLSNLVLNARDAMSNHGKVYVETRIKKVGSREYVIITVRDHGSGMDDETRARIFEPFYTTKPVDRGTGLGLSAVYGIVSGSGGTISVESQLGTGTTFEITWPREPYVDSTTISTDDIADHDGVTILLVEDNPRVGPITKRFLENADYNVTLARDGREGLLIFSKRPDEFDLVLSDVVLPLMNGIEMVDEIKRIKPSIRVGFISGFTDHPSLRGATLPRDAKILHKPFTQANLHTFVERQRNTETNTKTKRQNKEEIEA